MSPITLLLLQLIVVLVSARICGWVAHRVGQPGIVGAMAAGALMNARGLLELVVMKIGREMFTLLRLMVLATTAMTTPRITLFAGRRTGGIRLPAQGEVAGS